MVAMIGTEISVGTLVLDFLELEAEGASVRRGASTYLQGPEGRARVLDLGRVDERHTTRLRGLAETHGITPVVESTADAARTPRPRGRRRRAARARRRRDQGDPGL